MIKNLCMLFMFCCSCVMSMEERVADHYDLRNSPNMREVSAVDLEANYPEFHVVNGASPDGLAWMNQTVAVIFENLTETERRSVLTCASRGQFDNQSGIVYFWKAVSYICDPISNLSKVAVVVLPILTSGIADEVSSDGGVNGDLSFSSRMNIATSVAGVLSLTFDKICGYADAKIASHEKVDLCLKAIHAQTTNDSVVGNTIVN